MNMTIAFAPTPGLVTRSPVLRTVGTWALWLRAIGADAVHVEKQPINPKTGAPWQASKTIARFDGPDAMPMAMAFLTAATGREPRAR